jgi:hypothetical protein
MYPARPPTEEGEALRHFPWHEDVRLAVGWAEGRDVIGVFRPANSGRPAYLVVLESEADDIVCIRDWRYAPYLMNELSFELSGTGQ